MEEFKKIEQEDSLLGWGTVASLLAKAADKAEEMERDDVFNMLSDSMTLMEKTADTPSKVFFDAYQFAFRIYFRMKSLDKDMPLNRMRKQMSGRDEEYAIDNYDYRFYMWAKTKGYTDKLDNLTIIIPADKLTPAERSRFDKKLGND